MHVVSYRLTTLLAPSWSLRQRTSFWRALIEMSLLGTLIVLAYYPFHQLIPSPISELISFASLAIYGFAAWRLEPGQGSWWRRSGRIALWLLIFGFVNGLIGWALIAFLPWKGGFLGVDLTTASVGPLLSIFSTSFIVASLFLPIRLLLTVWGLGRQRLRWQLTFSHLLIGILTNFFVPLALVAYIAIISLGVVPTIVPPEQLAPSLAAAITPSVRAGAEAATLNATLAGLIDGSTRLPITEDERIAGAESLSGERGVRRVTLLSIDGRVLASAGREAFAVDQPLPVELVAANQLLFDTAFAEGGCTRGRPASGPLADAAACVIDDLEGQALALLMVENNLDGASQLGAGFSRVITLTILGFSLLINIIVLVVIAIVPVALGIGYLLARWLTRRIERLDAVAGDLATGQLERRVTIESQDEIGRLGETLNTMAAQLAEREAALAAAAARAEQLLRANRRLVADVSHELRNPLATLRGYLEALEQSHGQLLPAQDMRVIEGELTRLTSLIEDLFTLARAEAQQLPLQLGPVDVGAMATKLAATLGPLARREREIELIAQLDPALPPAQADTVRLEQVLRNLIQNALRHTPPGGIIVIEAEAAPEGGISLAVADTGMGISPEDLPLVFERFYRGDSSRARETGGAGLGLALVYELVSAMGGTVSAESTLGRGSRFTVRLRATD
ncbi:MAG: ATP-binding protein [Oscillochloridaceae bacterium umkhey_bin13]